MKPHLRQQYVIPPEQDAEFVAHMEEVLEIYHLPYDPKRPVICMDEQPIQLVKETRIPLLAKPGYPESTDYEYERNGTANIFLFTEPLAGWREVIVSERRTAVDWAQEIQQLRDHDYAQSDTVMLVCDQLNIHKLASLYAAFTPATARRLVERLEIHYTLKHGSWLNIGENELSALTRQTLERETTAWSMNRNQVQKSVVGLRPAEGVWQFTTTDARIRLKRLYPQIENWQTTRVSLQHYVGKSSVQDKSLQKENREGFHENYDILTMKPYESGYANVQNVAASSGLAWRKNHIFSFVSHCCISSQNSESRLSG